MLVYDVTSERSFENIKNWMRNIDEHASDDVEKMIIGNKADKNLPEDTRVVSTERGQTLAMEHEVLFYETSAKDGNNVEDAFVAIARKIKDKMEEKRRQDEELNKPKRTIRIGDEDTNDRSFGSGCCQKYF